MPEIALEQARWQRDDNGPPQLLARSPGFQDAWLPGVERLLVGFGIRPPGLACPHALFAQLLGPAHVAVVEVADRGAPLALFYRVLIVNRAEYEQFLGDPFALV